MGSRTKHRSVAGVVVAFGLGGAAACVLADPPAALPVAPIEPPEIERESVVPLEPFLETWPADFVVPVGADSREAEIQGQFLVDQTAVVVRNQDVEADGGVLLQVSDPQQPATLAECHTIEIRVTYPDAPGEDSIFWFYSPTGSFENCPIYDAGPGDSGVDGGERD